MFPLRESASSLAAPVGLDLSRRAGAGAGSEQFGLLEPIYRRERASLLRYLGKRAGTQAAPDLLHEVFVRAAASPQVADLNNPVGFLYRIACNLLIDRARRRRLRIELLPMLEARDAPTGATQEHRIEKQDLQTVIDRALAALPDKTRRVFVMHRFGGMSYREIQAALGISMATVEYHMMRALTQLRCAAQAADLLDLPREKRRVTRKNNFNCN